MSNGLTASEREVLANVPKVLRALKAENEKLASIVQEFEKRAQAEDLASEMERRGLGSPDSSFRDRVDQIMNSKRDLSVIKEAMDLAASQNLGFATVSDDDDHVSSTDAFENFILNGE